MRSLVAMAVVLGGVGDAAAQRWEDATADCLGTTAQWTNDVEVADVDGDGLVDILLANGGNYDSPGSLEASRVWRNLGGWDTAGSHCSEISAQALGGAMGLARTIRAADVDGDGDVDLVTGGAYQTQLRMFLRDGGTWIDATAKLPQQATSIGDVEFGDVDGDGDLDMLLAEWGPVSPGANNYPGGRTRLYTNDGSGGFTDATPAQMPDLLVLWSWDVELVDIDNDWDLDALVSCKLCATSLAFRNDGSGRFTNDPTAIPVASNNYDFEAMDIDHDGDLDLVTINDGGQLRDRLLVNDGTGVFTDGSARLGSNPSADDNAAVWLDADSDGDADLLIASLGNDRLLLNDGTGNFTASASATPNDTRASLGIAVVDLDGDGRLDVVQGQGESAFSDKIQLATAMIAIDTAPPVVRVERVGDRIFARVHDHQSPSRAHDWNRVFVQLENADELELEWYGEYLWRSPPTTGTPARACATDRRGNLGCSDMPPVTGDGSAAGDDAGIEPPGGGGGGGCCDSNSRSAGLLLPLAVVLLGLRRRRSRWP